MTDNTLIDVYDLKKTCDACPSQWEGRAGEVGSIYIRYRWGILTAHLSHGDFNAVKNGELIFDKQMDHELGDRLGGMLDTLQMQTILRDICRFAA